MEVSVGCAICGLYGIFRILFGAKNSVRGPEGRFIVLSKELVNRVALKGQRFIHICLLIHFQSPRSDTVDLYNFRLAICSSACDRPMRPNAAASSDSSRGQAINHVLERAHGRASTVSREPHSWSLYTSRNNVQCFSESVIVVDYPCGGSHPIHRHNAHRFIYVLEGSVVIQVKSCGQWP